MLPYMFYSLYCLLTDSSQEPNNKWKNLGLFTSAEEATTSGTKFNNKKIVPHVKRQFFIITLCSDDCNKC